MQSLDAGFVMEILFHENFGALVEHSSGFALHVMTIIIIYETILTTRLSDEQRTSHQYGSFQYVASCWRLKVRICRLPLYNFQNFT